MLCLPPAFPLSNQAVNCTGFLFDDGTNQENVLDGITMSPAVSLFFGWVSSSVTLSGLRGHIDADLEVRGLLFWALPLPQWVRTSSLCVVDSHYPLMAATVRRILIDDPEFIFPPSLQQVTLYRSMQGTSELHSALAKSKMKVSPKTSAIPSHV